MIHVRKYTANDLAITEIQCVQKSPINEKSISWINSTKKIHENWISTNIDEITYADKHNNEISGNWNSTHIDETEVHVMPPFINEYNDKSYIYIHTNQYTCQCTTAMIELSF